MDKSNAERYWLLASSGEEGPREGALAMLKAKLTKLNIVKESNVLDVPTNLTYGTFDDLIRLADDIQKQDYYCEAVLRRLERQGLELDPNSQFVIVQQRKSMTAAQYLNRFQWDDSRLPRNRNLKDNLSVLVQNANRLEEEVRNKTSHYNEIKQKSTGLQKKDVPLPQRDLVDVFTPDVVREGDFVTTENLTTLVCILSKSSEQTFLSTYESWSDLVCPRSAMKFDGVGDKENNVAYRVVVFKRALTTFLEAARKSKVHCREYSHNPTAFDTKEAERSTVEAEIVKAESFLLRVILAAFSELFISSVHLKVMKLFVECVLRFGIPPKFNAFVLKPVNAGKEAKLHKTLAQMLTSDFESHQPQDGEDEAYYPYVFLSFIPFLQYIQK